VAETWLRESTSDARAPFERNGFHIFDPGIPLATLDRVVADCRPLLGKAGRVQDAWKRSASVHRLAVWPSVMEMLRELYGRPARPFQTLNFPRGTQQKVHSDTIHFNSDPAGRLCGVWIALEDIDEDKGPLVCYPGTHKWPEITLADLEREGYLRRGPRDSLAPLSHRLGFPNIGGAPHYCIRCSSQ
jgi:Phytanoyl-CoA dioxygenase (PhyH)